MPYVDLRKTLCVFCCVSYHSKQEIKGAEMDVLKFSTVPIFRQLYYKSRENQTTYVDYRKSYLKIWGFNTKVRFPNKPNSTQKARLALSFSSNYDHNTWCNAYYANKVENSPACGVTRSSEPTSDYLMSSKFQTTYFVSFS